MTMRRIVLRLLTKGVVAKEMSVCWLRRECRTVCEYATKWHGIASSSSACRRGCGSSSDIGRPPITSYTRYLIWHFFSFACVCCSLSDSHHSYKLVSPPLLPFFCLLFVRSCYRLIYIYEGPFPYTSPLDLFCLFSTWIRWSHRYAFPPSLSSLSLAHTQTHTHHIHREKKKLTCLIDCPLGAADPISSNCWW